MTPPTGKEGAKDWRGLGIVRELQIKFEDAERSVGSLYELGTLVFFVAESC